jgi:hypothetical protein
MSKRRVHEIVSKGTHNYKDVDFGTRIEWEATFCPLLNEHTSLIKEMVRLVLNYLIIVRHRFDPQLCLGHRIQNPYHSTSVPKKCQNHMCMGLQTFAEAVNEVRLIAKMKYAYQWSQIWSVGILYSTDYRKESILSISSNSVSIVFDGYHYYCQNLTPTTKHNIQTQIEESKFHSNKNDHTVKEIRIRLNLAIQNFDVMINGQTHLNCVNADVWKYPLEHCKFYFWSYEPCDLKLLPP